MNLDLDKSTWKRVRFGDVVRNVNKSTKDPESLGIGRVIAMEHMDPGELKIDRWGDLADGTTFTRVVTPGQTLFGKRRAYQRKVAYAEFDAICSGDIYTFEAIEGELLPRLLPFLVQSEGFFNHALGTSAGSLSPRTNWRDLAGFEFGLPPIEEQERFADLLWAVEEHHRSMAGDIEACEAAQSSWLDRILHDGSWSKRPVSEVVTAGPTNGRSAPANDEGRGVPTLSLSAVRGGRIVGGSSIKFIDVDPAAVANYVVEDDDFLIVRGNGNRQLTGRGGLVQGGLPEGCVYPDLLIRLRFDHQQILPRFAAAQWNATGAHGDLLRTAKSTNGIWKINGKDIKAHALVVPPLVEQAAIVTRLEDMDQAITNARNEATALVALRKSFLTEIFGDA